jgi:hypothetical protein
MAPTLAASCTVSLSCRLAGPGKQTPLASMRSGRCVLRVDDALAVDARQAAQTRRFGAVARLTARTDRSPAQRDAPPESHRTCAPRWRQCQCQHIRCFQAHAHDKSAVAATCAHIGATDGDTCTGRPSSSGALRKQILDVVLLRRIVALLRSRVRGALAQLGGVGGRSCTKLRHRCTRDRPCTCANDRTGTLDNPPMRIAHRHTSWICTRCSSQRQFLRRECTAAIGLWQKRLVAVVRALRCAHTIKPGRYNARNVDSGSSVSVHEGRAPPASHT